MIGKLTLQTGRHVWSETPDRTTALFSLRAMKFFLVWLICWQESTVGGSPFQLDAYMSMPFGLWPTEFLLLIFAVVLGIERTLTGDFSIRRSYLYGPVLLILFALFLSWLRGCWLNQAVRPVFEAHEAFRIPIAFFLILNGFKERGDGLLLIQAVLYAGIAKSIDGAYIYFFSASETKGWGVIQMWRDGYVVAYVLTAALIVLQYRGKRELLFKRILLWGSPIALFTLIVSYRRTFFLGLLVSALTLFITIGKGRRAKHALIVFSLVIALIIVIVLTDPIAFLTRFFGVIDPSGEGSAYIRLMELPNVLLNIRDNPILGTAIGTQWHQYFRMPLYANFTSIGVHNTYLYWQLRAGILGTIGFYWLLARVWKGVLIPWRLVKTEDEFLTSQLTIYLMVIYQVGCAFGMMYGDAMSSVLAIILVIVQLELTDRTGLTSFKGVDFLRSFRSRSVVMRPKPAVILHSQLA